MLSRRKPTTYGKRSRHHVPGVSPAAGDEFGRVPVQSNWNEAKIKISRAGTQLPSNRVVTNASNNGVKAMADTYNPSTLKPSSRERPTALTGPKRVYVPPESGPISPSSDIDALYDVPSSDEEGREILSSRGPVVGKRRKIAPTIGLEEVTYVYDDETLQRHIAAEAHINSKTTSPYNGQVDGTRRPPSSQGLMGNPHRELVDSASEKRQALSAARIITKPTQVPINGDESKAKRLTRAAVSNLQSQKRRRTNVREIAKNGSAKMKTKSVSYRPPRPSGDAQVSLKGHNVPAEKTTQATKPRSNDTSEDSIYSANVIPQPQTPPHTPPRSLRSTGRTTTPHQRELWGMLLKDDQRISSPSNLGLPNLMIADSKAEKPRGNRADRERPRNAAQPMPPMRNSRERLVDKLQRVDRDKLDSSDRSDENATSDDDNGYHNCQSQASYDHGILPSDALQNANGQRTGVNGRDPTLSKAGQPIIQGGGLKVTYACHRSYLTDDGLGEAAIFGMPITHKTASDYKNGPRRVSATVAELEPFKSSHDEMDDNECSQGGTMRSIHELREAGGTVRLISEMETMLDDIDEKNTVSVPLRRTALLDLVVKIQETSFCHLFVGQQLELRLLANIGLSNDIIIDVLYAVAVWHLLVDPTSIQTLSRVKANHVVNHLVRLLDNDQDVAQLLGNRKMNMSKLAQLDFRNYFDLLLKSANWRGGNPPTLTPRVLCLQCLEYIVRQTREAGSKADVLPLQAMRGIVKILEPTAPSLKPLPSIPLSTDLRLAVSILESCTLSHAHLTSDLLWTGETLDIVAELLPLLVPMTDRASGTLQTLVLRLNLNLTNNNPELCKAFSRPNLISAVFDITISHFRDLSEGMANTEQSLILDNLILSLGFLINLAEWCEHLGHMVLDLRYGDATFLGCLLEIFVAKLGKAGEVRPSVPSTN